MKNIIKISVISLLLINIFSIGILTANAAGLLPAESNKPANCTSTNCGGYTLNDMANVAITVSQFILGIVGSLALLAFVAGGLMMMLSAGNPEWVTRGKQTLIGAVIGLAIVFTSYAIIQLVFTALGITAADKGLWSTFTGTTKDWFGN
ncbi:MAG: hypothetical protein WC349_03015 [Patescibacteria group bacterium]|jgi:hypothetical protein